MQLLLTMYRSIIIILVLRYGCCGEELKAEARDSYVDAYHETHGPPTQNVNKHERDSQYFPSYDNSAPEFYGPPHQGYPEPNYPSSNYGPPVYGPPNHVPSFPAPFYGAPHALLGLLDKFKLKLNIYTILKIILKLVIFKKIVSFIALICLLLFIPKFKFAKEDDQMEDLDSRSFKNSQASARLNTLTQFVMRAIDKYSDKNSTNEGMYDVAERMFNDIDNKLSYQRLFTMYTNKGS